MHEKGLEVYFRDINRYDLITREDEVALALRIKAGEEEALQCLVRANLRFVVSVAKRYINQGLMLSDLINEGNLGLLKAAHRFDEKRGYRFISYAVWWIRQSIMQALLDKSRTIRLPQNQTALLIKISRTRSILQNEGNPQPTPDQIAQRLDLDVADVVHALRSDRTELALEDSGAEGGDRPLAEVIPDTSQEPPDFAVLQRGLREDVRKCLAVLSDREAQIIIQYFGLSFEEAQTLEVIGRRLGLTRERIRQIKEKALARLRNSKGKVLLFDYY
ncbi:MAG: RNA polymerase sigma factor RpoD/SigA [Candidatus Krumholzibacteria bacterium]|nr:RNA polymerase sigma factor RpoD/SigA [Candidatus Krumholzibacteria bacterium]